MKKTLTTLAVLGVCAAMPAFAADFSTSSTKSTYVEKTTYHTEEVPLTEEQVAERQRMGTKIEETINRVDTDGDRELSRAEYSYSSKLFPINDSNQAQAFYNIDANHDGHLSSQELLKAELAQKDGTMPVIEPASGSSTRVIERHTTTYAK